MLDAALAVAAVLTLATGCETARMPVSASLMNAAPEAVCTGRQGFTFSEAFACGPYRVTDVDRSWTVTRSWDEIWFESSRADQHYEFALEAGDATWDGQFAVGADVDLLELERFLGGGFEIRFLDERFLVGALRARDETDPWRLAIGRSGDERTMAGALTRGDVVVLVEGTNRLADSPIPVSEETGYVLSMDGQEVAAVEVINDGRIWIRSSLNAELRQALAAAAAALLLYRDLETG